MNLIFATHNLHKLAEIQRLLPDGFQLTGLTDLGLHEEIPEPGATLEENSLLKANYVHERFSCPVIADDSGLEVAALEGAPGVHSARYAGPGRDFNDNMDLLLKNLAPFADHSAKFVTVITYIDSAGKVHVFRGEMPGTIITQKRGTNGFGYDPIFLPQGHDRTFAEMSNEEKNAISHRARAFEKLIHYLSAQK
jgi:XTP/dITP diphosphohydrolase